MNTQPDIATLLRARTTLLWVTTREELRVERAIIEAAGKVGFGAVLWDCSSGTLDASGRPYGQGQQLRDPEQALGACKNDGRKAVWIFRDLDVWLGAPTTARIVKTLARDLQAAPAGAERTIVILTSAGKIPESLQGSAMAMDWPLPSREDVGKILDATVDGTVSAMKSKKDPDDKTAARITALQVVKENGRREACIDAAVGLTAEEIAGCYARSLVSTGTIDPNVVRKDKAAVISREKVLEWYEPDPRGWDAIGGLGNMKRWLRKHLLAFSKKAQEYGLPSPRGILVCGVAGTGKSLTAKAVASAWGMPLLRLDLGALKSKWVGESEANVRHAFRVAESVAPCILWIDEIEKSLEGATGGAADGGVSSDALGTLLTFMQERKAPVFIIATANDVSKLPPELLRKGRFDEIFFVDLPMHSERMEIAATAIRKVGRKVEDFDLESIAKETGDFTGAEIAACIPEAMFDAFASGREVNTFDVVSVARRTIPLARTASEKVRSLREWCQGRAVPAADPEAEPMLAESLGRAISE